MAEENRAPEMRAPARAQAQAQAQALEGRSLFPSSDDDILSREIEKLHKLDGQRAVKPEGFLIETTENVIPSITRTLQLYFTVMVHGIDDASPLTGDEEQGQLRQDVNRIAEGLNQCTEELAAVIHKIHSDITSGLARGIDNHSITMEVLNIVSRFPWGVKAVLPMVAFTVIYRDSCILHQMHDTTPLAKSVALIKGLPGAQVNIRPIYKLRFESVPNLINEMLQTTQCIRFIEALPIEYVPDEHPDLKDARNLFPNAVYAIIRSVVAAAAQISTSTPKRELYSVKPCSDKRKCRLPSDEKMEEELYRRIRIFVYEKVHMDNIAVLKVLISEDDSVPALYDCQAKRRVHLDKLRRRNVSLLISGLDITHEELYVLEQAYTKSRFHAYEMVWIPVVDQSTQWTDAMRLQFETLQASMPWYTVHDPKIIRKAVIKFFRQDWHFYGKPILVVLDPQGRVVSPNAIHMMWIWQSKAFPFTSAREEELWQKQIWSLELLVDAIDQRLLEWCLKASSNLSQLLLGMFENTRSIRGSFNCVQQIREGKYIILYGGDNLKWIRDFTTRGKNIARDLRVAVEMVYVGKSHHKHFYQLLLIFFKIFTFCKSFLKKNYYLVIK
ncbi:hypothetical protein Cgig2_005426 [Carnegiea gigantea]|uniref:Sieve element occlusion N-terminal domain-containing protein n=1 Tax=Carnegiea gigantea TaxID=171969 RepID=A0A9Q1KD09_9CARY|nr:hypothetical protein Cgig2_005426 [Carnegiea gigantea]